MKKTLKIVLVLAISIASMQSVNAQIKFGPIAGLNISNISGDNSNDNSMLLGAHLGGLVNFSLSDNLSVEPQVLYSMKGANVEIENVVSGTETYVYRLSYLEIPIWVRYQLESGLNFQAGPHIGILLAAEFDGEDAKDGLNSFDFGVGGGLGYQMENGLGFGLNYNLGLANIVDTEGGDDFSNSNNCIKFSISYTLGND
ncbi:MAG: PorT family protein [Bacteroidia bacterium]|nr:PorT family protein [Bacteroidia bacterium]